ncbi:MAG: leucyl aminopeptidase family protein [Tatlockia sp.]|nr:leucyl aminopeptidase family protein [Tatlockia sp.]
MQPEMFYTTNSDGSIPLILLTKNQYELGIETFTQQENNHFKLAQFSGKPGEVCLITTNDGQLSKAYLGTGEGNQMLALAVAATRLPAASFLPQQNVSHTAKVIWSLAQYRFSVYKKQTLSHRVLVVNEEGFDEIIAESKAVYLVRDLINTPTNNLGPAELSSVLENLAHEFGADFKEWVGDELLSAHFEAIHTVGRASAKAPRLLYLNWGSPKDPRLCLIGKGVCFDSGGLDIKPCDGMRLMKKDMGGAAHVIGLAQSIMSQNLPVNLLVYIPAVENSIGPDSYRPGDVITMYNGLTVEVANTDAEGRLILADAIAKACEEKPDLLIDFSTLTGAARVAVGTEIAAMFSNDDRLAQELSESALAINDPIWRLPLFAGYESMIESPIADLSNLAPSPYAGAITAALFLQHFVTKNLPWVHFDIMAWNLGNKPGRPEGGEAMGLRALMHYLGKVYKKY